MALILRIVRKSRWCFPPPWLPEDDVQADSLVDFSTKNNELSVWHIEDESNLERIISALAANRDTLSNFDYALFDNKILVDNNIKLRESKGISLDEEMNDLFHFDLYELSANKVANLTICIMKEGKINRIHERDIKQFIINSIEAGNIKPDNLKDKLRNKINKG